MGAAEELLECCLLKAGLRRHGVVPRVGEGRKLVPWGCKLYMGYENSQYIGHFVYMPPGVAVRILLLILRHGEQSLAGPLLATASRVEYLRMVANSEQVRNKYEYHSLAPRVAGASRCLQGSRRWTR